MGGAAVSALAHHGDVKQVYAGGQGAGMEHHAAGGLVGHHVHTEDGVHVVHHAQLHQFLGAAGQGVFTVLEDELHIAGKGVAALHQQLGNAQQHSHVHIVTAAVHKAGVLAGKGQAGFFGDGQRVDVGADGDGLACALGAADVTHHGGGDGALDIRNAQFGELVKNQLAGAHLGAAQFGPAVYGAADLYQFVKTGLCSLIQFVHRGLLLRLRPKAANTY